MLTVQAGCHVYSQGFTISHMLHQLVLRSSQNASPRPPWFALPQLTLIAGLIDYSIDYVQSVALLACVRHACLCQRTRCGCFGTSTLLFPLKSVSLLQIGFYCFRTDELAS